MFKIPTWLFALLAFLLMLLSLGFYMVNFSAITIPQTLQQYLIDYAPKSTLEELNNLSTDKGDWGTFGDYLGGTLNPIFGFFGFLALLATLSLQRKQLDEQRQAIKQQEEDMEAQRKSLAISSKTQIKQQFEGTFFKLLEMLRTEELIWEKITWERSSPQGKSKNNAYGFNQSAYFRYLNDQSNEQGLIENLRGDLDISSLKLNNFYKILSKIILSIDGLYYPSFERDTYLDKNFYIDLFLMRLNEGTIFAFAIAHLHPWNATDFVDANVRTLITNLGLLRRLNNKISLEQYDESILKNYLMRNFGEQAFKPIEVPPTNA